MTKSKEEILRDEVHFYSDMNQKYVQWGLTVMVSIQTAIFFLRRELLQTYVDAGLLQKGQELFYRRYLIGTAFLLLAAYVLHRFSRRVTEQYRHYKEQLLQNNESGVRDKPTTGVSKWTTYLYFAFPAFDVLSRLWIDVSFKLSVH
jgi:hypothetical protein